jgi:hypothetical protein
LVSDNFSIRGEILNLAMVVNSANSSGVGKMWLSLIPGDFSLIDPGLVNPSPVAYMLQFANPTQFSVGSNKFGVLEITERRQIVRSFIDMMGFTPVCGILLAPFLIWLTQPDRPEIQLYWFNINSSAYASRYIREVRSYLLVSGITDELLLDNNTVAQLTLKWDRSITQQVNGFPLLYPVILDYRQHTFLDTLSSIGGLLATLQGLHISFFGRPLWWGLFGTPLFYFIRCRVSSNYSHCR